MLSRIQKENIWGLLSILKAAHDREDMQKLQDRLSAAAEKRLQVLAASAFKDLWDQIESGLNDGSLFLNNIEYDIDWDGWSLSLAREFKGEIGDVLSEVGDAIHKEVKGTLAWDITADPAVKQWLNEHTAEFVVQITDETRNAINAVIKENYLAWQEGGIKAMSKTLQNFVGLTEYQAKIVSNYQDALESEMAAGNITLTDAELQDMVHEKFLAVLERRCDLIASNEANIATRYGTLSTYDNNPTITAVQWMTTSDVPCEDCIAMDGKIMTMAEFEDTISTIHNGTSIGCQCRPLPVTENTQDDEQYWADRKEAFEAAVNKSGCSEGCHCERHRREAA